MIQATSRGGISALYMAMLNGHTGCVQAYYDFLVADNNHLSNEDLINLFQVHNSEYDMTALSYAVSNNDEKFIDIYFHAVYQVCQKKSINYRELVLDEVQEQYNNFCAKQSILKPPLSSIFSSSFGVHTGNDDVSTEYYGSLTHLNGSPGQDGGTPVQQGMPIVAYHIKRPRSPDNLDPNNHTRTKPRFSDLA